ncbi:head-tail adaptor protein [Aestuariivita boseongensis]|uniref:head-tail adaptor protein n=1 Tax=Aestuariivita boseongensis TaxID=1470562 RepID=UPI000681F824|nr:head-tail adaptor protein [Aestuariivita boseongensis]
MGAPHLNRALVLEASERVADGAGGFSESWVQLGTLWAEVTTRSGREARDVVSAVSAVMLRIVVRGAPVGSAARPLAGQRFREGTRIFAIEAVSEWDPAGRYLVCFAKEEVAT